MDCKIKEKNGIDILGIELNEKKYDKKLCKKIDSALISIDRIQRMNNNHQKFRMLSKCLRQEGIMYYIQNQRLYVDIIK